MYFFWSQITVVINKIEKSTQCDLNCIFYEISEYVNSFCIKIFPLQKKAISEHQFFENDVACECSLWKTIGKLMLVAIIQYTMFLLQSLPFKSQNCDVYFSKDFALETRLSTSPIFVIIYFQIWCSNTEYGQKSYQVDDHYTRYGTIEHTVTAAEYAPMLHD